MIHHVDVAVADFERRPRYAQLYYAAYVLDPDGHNVEAVCREPA